MLRIADRAPTTLLQSAGRPTAAPVTQTSWPSAPLVSGVCDPLDMFSETGLHSVDICCPGRVMVGLDSILDQHEVCDLAVHGRLEYLNPAVELHIHGYVVPPLGPLDL